MKQTLIMTTGGIESTVATIQALKNESRIILIHYSLGRIQDPRELHFVNKFAISNNVPLKIVNFPGIQEMFSGIIDPEFLNSDEGDVACPNEVSFLPGLSQLSLLFARQAGISKLIIGLTKEQLTPDRISFFKNMVESNNKFNPNIHNCEIELPFSDLEKADVIKLGQKMNVDFKETWSCYNGDTKHCGKCSSCKERKQAFENSKITDPTEYIL